MKVGLFNLLHFLVIEHFLDLPITVMVDIVV